MDTKRQPVTLVINLSVLEAST